MSTLWVKYPSKIKSQHFGCVLGGALALAITAPLASADAKPFQTLYTFTGSPDGADPNSGLLRDKAGNFYGSTSHGGDVNCNNGIGCGILFKIAPDGTQTVLHQFEGGDGLAPQGDLIQDKAGNLYGTTPLGGTNGFGTIFKLAPDGTESVLYSFGTGTDGTVPPAGLIMDKAGNLYGTTFGSGSGGYGTVYKLSPTGSMTVLYNFTGGSDGGYPFCALISDKMGNLYGTTAVGGAKSAGTVFKLAPNGTETVLHSFGKGTDGTNPEATLISDKVGNFYSTTTGGGASGKGTVFKLAPDGTETVLYAFQGGNDGASPVSAVKMDKAGNLYGATTQGGGTGCNNVGCGVIFEIALNGTETLLHSFTGGSDGGTPSASLTLHKNRLYGTAANGGADGFGTVFSVKE